MSTHTSSARPLRLFAGGVSTETNTFSPLPTGLDDYHVVRSTDDPEKAIFGSTLEMTPRGFAAVASASG